MREFFDQMLVLPEKPVDKIDVFLCSNGGSGTVPWRLTALLREYAKSFGVLIPYRAYSAATLLALGADEIVMHPFGEMGPIDPSVANEFNPVDKNTGQRIGINVEDVRAYVSFIKETVGITHEDELIKAMEILANRIHPLALGNVERFVSQSRMTARKILSTHMGETDRHVIDEIVESLASKLYFHGHPINRQEARMELKLKVVEEPGAELEDAMWDLYKLYEAEFENKRSYNPANDLLLAAIPPGGTPQKVPYEIEQDLLYAMIESPRLASRYTARKRFLLLGFGQNQEPLIREDTISDGWKPDPAPKAAPSRKTKAAPSRKTKARRSRTKAAGIPRRPHS